MDKRTDPFGWIYYKLGTSWNEDEENGFKDAIEISYCVQYIIPNDVTEY